MLADNLIQQDLITKLKAIPTGTAYLGDGASGIRELEWQGDTFTYPNIRLDIESTNYVFDEQEKCALYLVEFSLYFFSQERSSKQGSQIKGLFENYFTGLGWTGANCKFNRLRLVDNIPAVRADEITWRSQLKYETRVQVP